VRILQQMSIPHYNNPKVDRLPCAGNVRLVWLKTTTWNLVILDEAQAIKNAGARQS